MNQTSVCVDIMLSFGRVRLGCEGCSVAGTSPCLLMVVAKATTMKVIEVWFCTSGAGYCPAELAPAPASVPVCPQDISHAEGFSVDGGTHIPRS